MKSGITRAGMFLLISTIISCSSAVAQEQSSEPSSQEQGLNSFFSSIFTPTASELKKLVDAKKFAEADALFSREAKYFRENKESNQKSLKALSVGLAGIFDPKVNLAIANLTSAKKWDEIKASILSAADLRNEIKNVAIFNENDFGLVSLILLDETLSETISLWKSRVTSEFKEYNHVVGRHFFADYPVDINESGFFDSNFETIKAIIEVLNTQQIEMFYKQYKSQFTRSDPYAHFISAQYLASLLPSKDTKPDLASILEAVQKAKELGFTPKYIPGVKIGFAEVTSKTLLKEGHIEFPAQVQMDLPFEPTKADIDELLSSTNIVLPDYLIIFDVAKANVSRRILSKNDVESKFVSGTTSEPNPQYEIARGKLFEAQAGLARAQSTYTPTVAAAIMNGIAIGVWRDNVSNAEASLNRTSPMVQRDLTSDYKFSTSEVKATKVMTTNYYVLDRAESKYFKGIFDISESKNYKISYNVNDKDTGKRDIQSKYDNEDDIGKFEQAPLVVPVSSLIYDYLKNRKLAKPLPTITKLRQEMLEDKNKSLASHKAQQFDGKPLKDPRFDSVVVILNPKGALGTGFFVRPSYVLTNYHVVEGVKFVEMKMFNGLETFGKVVKSDVRLDLALIKVQDQGVPVEFYDGNTIDLGATVEAIGHPKGLTFSITRGVTSAVRKKKSVYAVGGKEILFVQTDAAINPGNSGGPLFLGQRVIGVNNNKLVGGSEGLGFAIHYAEVGDFLRESF